MNFVAKIQRKLVKSVRVRGFWGTTKLALMQPFIHLQNARSTRIRNRTQGDFDKAHGTNTGGIIPLSELQVDSPNWIYGVRYGPTAPGRFRECLAMVPVKATDYKSFTFIDLGSGKGATLLYASDLGFRKVIGVEFVRSLHDIAEENIRRYPSAISRAASICCDAIEYRFPDEPLIVFASNPFPGNLMDKVLGNLSQTAMLKFFVHENSVYSLGDLPAANFLRRIASDTACTVYAGKEAAKS